MECPACNDPFNTPNCDGKVPNRSYYDTIDYETGDIVPEKPMTCAHCGDPVFYEESESKRGYYHAVENPNRECFGYYSWIEDDEDDPNHPLYEEWHRNHAK